MRGQEHPKYEVGDTVAIVSYRGAAGEVVTMAKVDRVTARDAVLTTGQRVNKAHSRIRTTSPFGLDSLVLTPDCEYVRNALAKQRDRLLASRVHGMLDEAMKSLRVRDFGAVLDYLADATHAIEEHRS